MANKIELLLSTPDAETNSPSSIRDSVTKYSWSNVADALIEEYKVFYDNPVVQVA
jgi:glycosyltransferase involved in cell wall biosynthesis